MKKYIVAAFQPPPRAITADDDSRYAILPQQTEDDLVLSEVHTKLDWALSFLQRDVGYSLLDDARPRPGGGVRLRQPDLDVNLRAVPRNRRSMRLPKKEEPEEVGDEEARQFVSFSPVLEKYVTYPDDLVLIWRFANILGEASPSAQSKVKHEILYKTVLQGVRLMHLCDFNYCDVVLSLAYASVYFRSTYGKIGHKMSENEAAHVCVLLIFLAHSFVLDETCPLRCWQNHIFRKYCTLKVLDAALFRLFKIRGFKLRITEEEEQHALSVLLCSKNGFDAILNNLCESENGSNAPRENGSSTSTSASSCAIAEAAAIT